MGAHHAACRFSATVTTTDVAVLHMLRTLCQHCEGDWRKNGNKVTFRFTQQADRKSFLDEAQRLLPGLWRLVKTNDLDPATPRR